MKCLEVSGAVRPIYGSLGVKRLTVRLKVKAKLYICGAPKTSFYIRSLWSGTDWHLEGLVFSATSRLMSGVSANTRPDTSYRIRCLVFSPGNYTNHTVFWPHHYAKFELP